MYTHTHAHHYVTTMFALWFLLSVTWGAGLAIFHSRSSALTTERCRLFEQCVEVLKEVSSVFSYDARYVTLFFQVRNRGHYMLEFEAHQHSFCVTWSAPASCSIQEWWYFVTRAFALLVYVCAHIFFVSQENVMSRFYKQRLMYNIWPIEQHVQAHKIPDIRQDQFAYAYFYGLHIHKVSGAMGRGGE